MKQLRRVIVEVKVDDVEGSIEKLDDAVNRKLTTIQEEYTLHQIVEYRVHTDCETFVAAETPLGLMQRIEHTAEMLLLVSKR